MQKFYFLRNVIAMAICLAGTMMFAGCGDKDDDSGDSGNTTDEQLPGQVFITPVGPAAVGTDLAAVYTESDIPEEDAVQVTFQWKKGSENASGTPTTVGNQSVYVPTTPGEYSVVVSAPGYQSKTSNVVVVTEATGDNP